MPGTSLAKNQEQPPPCPVQAHHHSVEKETTGLHLAAHRSCVAHRHGLPRLCSSSFQISNDGETSDRNVYCQLLRNLKSAIVWCFLPQGAQCHPDWVSSSYHGIPSTWLSWYLWVTSWAIGILGLWPMIRTSHTKQILTGKLWGHSCWLSEQYKGRITTPCGPGEKLRSWDLKCLARFLLLVRG